MDTTTEGVIDRWDRVTGECLDPLSMEEYHYWMTHGLPFGWAIVRAPKGRSEEVKEDTATLKLLKAIFFLALSGIAILLLDWLPELIRGAL